MHRRRNAFDFQMVGLDIVAMDNAIPQRGSRRHNRRAAKARIAADGAIHQFQTSAPDIDSGSPFRKIVGNQAVLKPTPAAAEHAAPGPGTARRVSNQAAMAQRAGVGNIRPAAFRRIVATDEAVRHGSASDENPAARIICRVADGQPIDEGET